jgi:hypothetical protein
MIKEKTAKKEVFRNQKIKILSRTAAGWSKEIIGGSNNPYRDYLSSIL